MTDSNNNTPLELEPIKNKKEKFFCPICSHVQYELSHCENCGVDLRPKKSKKGLLIISILAILIIVSFFFIKDKNNNRFISMDKNNELLFTKPDLSKTIEGLKGLVQEGKQQIDGTVSIHKWQDENGVWHYSQQAPDDKNANQESEVINIDLDTNVIPNNDQ